MNQTSFTPVCLGRYVLLDRIGHGGMAEIFRAVSEGVEGFRKLVAVKRILAHLAADDTFRRMFINEAKLAALIEHPNAVQIFELGELDGQLFIAMEYVAGVDLGLVLMDAYAQNHPLPLEVALYIAVEFLRGLDYAHNLKDGNGEHLRLIHRDVSPSNVLVSFEGVVKLGDFGIAKAQHFSSHTQTGTIKGKIPYMSPELIDGKEIDWRSDIWAAGVVIWETLASKRLYTGKSDFQLLSDIVSGPVLSLEGARPDLDRKIISVVNRALRKNRNKRYQTAGEMADALASAAAQKGIILSPIPLRQHMQQRFSKNTTELRALTSNLDAILKTSPGGSQAKPAPEERTAPMTPKRAGTQILGSVADPAETPPKDEPADNTGSEGNPAESEDSANTALIDLPSGPKGPLPVSSAPLIRAQDPPGSSQLAAASQIDPLLAAPIADPLLGGPIADPLQQGQIADPLLQGQIADPLLQGQIADPLKQGQIADPLLQGQIADPLLQGQIADPLQQGETADPVHTTPAAVPVVATNAEDKQQNHLASTQPSMPAVEQPPTEAEEPEPPVDATAAVEGETSPEAPAAEAEGAEPTIMAPAPSPQSPQPDHGPQEPAPSPVEEQPTPAKKITPAVPEPVSSVSPAPVYVVPAPVDAVAAAPTASPEINSAAEPADTAQQQPSQPVGPVEQAAFDAQPLPPVTRKKRSSRGSWLFIIIAICLAPLLALALWSGLWVILWKPTDDLAQLRVVSVPPGAQVSIDGTTQKQRTPLKVKIAEASHTIQVQLKDYQPETVTVNLVAGKEKSVSLTLVPKSHRSVDAGTTQGADVSTQGADVSAVGVADAALAAIDATPAPDHREKPDSAAPLPDAGGLDTVVADTRVPTQDAAGSPDRRSNKPDAKPIREANTVAKPSGPAGWITITAKPWGYITLNGERLKKPTPIYRKRVPSGVHTLVVENPYTHKKIERKVRVLPRKHSNARFDLRADR